MEWILIIIGIFVIFVVAQCGFFIYCAFSSKETLEEQLAHAEQQKRWCEGAAEKFYNELIFNLGDSEVRAIKGDEYDQARQHANHWGGEINRLKEEMARRKKA